MSHEDFEPLRIRPYVTLPDPEPDPADDVVGAAYPTVPIAAAPVLEAEAAGPPDPPRPPGRRRRPFTVIAGGVAAVAALGTVAFAGGLFSADDTVRDQALPDTASSTPDDPVPPPAAPPSAASATPSAAPPAARPPRPVTPSAPAAPAPRASASPTAAASPSPSAPTARATAEISSPATRAPSAAVLQLGDSGPGVVELQQRMNQVYVYRAAPDGRYDADVEDAVRQYQSWLDIRSDPPGVYGPETRQALEATTQEPR
ncbi:peptidoglycan-binding domain-containing protein [Streptomyces sp. NBC_00344]|uniref:peptidoglycan-binding domain-containing protein n=1 Tax=Streptomyces sp. NBC_00344 TaxID=2975720 RepID=UPI002E23EC6D